MDEDTLVRIKRAKIKLQRDKPFFANLLFFIDIKEDNEQCPTMSVDARGNLYYNVKWISTLTDAQLRGVLAHETLHLGLLHIARGVNKLSPGLEGQDKHEVWNLAIDAAANWVCVANGFELPPGAMKPDLYSKTCYLVSIDDQGREKVIQTIDNVNEKSAEQIFVELLRNVKKGSGRGKGKGKGGWDIHIYNNPNGEPLPKEELDKIEKIWKQRITNAIYRSKSEGKMPAGLDRLLEDLLEPKVDWREKMYKFVTNDTISDYTWRRPHKRSEGVGVYMPSFLKERLNVAFFADVSGSIGNEEIQQFRSEAFALARSFDNLSMIFGFCDARVTNVIEINDDAKEEIVGLKPKGGGGTDMRECFEWLKENRKEPEAIVILTDGYTPFPMPEDVDANKVLWLISPNGIKEDQFKDGIGEFIKMRG